jgi:hypothetical protein
VNSGSLFAEFSPLRLFGRRSWWFLATLIAGSAPASEPGTGNQVSPVATPAPRSTTWAWRETVTEQLKTVAEPNKGTTPAVYTNALLAHAVPDAPDSDVVALAPFPVRGDRLEAKLHGILVRQEQDAKDEAVLRRTGTGFHGVKFGHWTAGVVTVFGIPVAAAVSASW